MSLVSRSMQDQTRERMSWPLLVWGDANDEEEVELELDRGLFGNPLLVLETSRSSSPDVGAFRSLCNSEGEEEEKEDEEDSIHWKVDLCGRPSSMFGFELGDRHDEERVEETTPLTGGRENTSNKSYSKILVEWEDVPREMRNKFLPLMKTNKKGYANVTPQPGIGSGYQVQAWSSRQKKTMRLATVQCEKVGALIVAAANLDTSLTDVKLAGREWFLKMMSLESFRSDWMQSH